MDIEKQLDEFYSILDYKPVSASAIALYNLILQIVRKSGWIDEVKIANTILTSKTRLSISAMQRARNELIFNNFIRYKKRKKSK